jgi:hypothetical protein
MLKLKDIWDQLFAISIKVDWEDLVVITLKRLTSSFENFVVTLNVMLMSLDNTFGMLCSPSLQGQLEKAIQKQQWSI